MNIDLQKVTEEEQGEQEQCRDEEDHGREKQSYGQRTQDAQRKSYWRPAQRPDVGQFHAIFDLAKNVFALPGVDATGCAALVRPSVARGKLLERLAALPPCLIGMEQTGKPL